MADKLRITLVKSTIGAVPKNKKTIEALGLTKLYKTVDEQIVYLKENKKIMVKDEHRKIFEERNLSENSMKF